MPAVSQAQRKLFAIAEHHPEELRAKNKSLASLPNKTLHEFSSTPEGGLPYRARPHREEDGHIVLPAAAKGRRFYGQLG